MSEGQGNTLERLLAQEGWLRSLARALVAEASAADDVAQETWARVLAQPPRAVDSPRAWLARIARRVVGERVRSERSQKWRERMAASERTEAVDEVAWADRLEAAARVQQDLARAVLDLSEPGRSAVVLRYFQGRSAAQIARETGVPESTVRNRLRRALAELREALDRAAGGDRSRWLPALLPIAGWPRLPLLNGPLLTTEALLMGLKTKLAIGAALLALASVPFVLRRADEPSPAPAAPISLAEQERSIAPGIVPIDPAPARVAAAGMHEVPERAPGGAVEEPAPHPPLPAGSLEVVVVRAGASAAEPDIPVTGGRVWIGLPDVVYLPRELEAESGRVRSANLDVAGIARFHGVPSGRLAIGVQIGHGSLVQTRVAVPPAEGARCVVRLGGSGLRGTVHDPSGPIVAGARVQLSLAAREEVHAVIWTDDEGRYEAQHLPSGSYGVDVDLSGWQSGAGEYSVRLELVPGTILEHDFGRPEGLPLWRGHVWTKAGLGALQPAYVVGHGGRIYLMRTDRFGYAQHYWKADGSFAIRLEPGVYDVSVSLPGRDERIELLTGLEVDPRERALERDLHVPGATLTGFVAAGQWISVRPAPGERPLVWIPRPADGFYHFDGIPPGRWWLTAGELAVEVTVLETDEVLTIDLR